MEAFPQELALGKCVEVDFDIVVFTNLTREDRDGEANLFARMVDPERHESG